METSTIREEASSTTKRASSFEIKNGVPISNFDPSTQSFLDVMGTISYLTEGTKVENIDERDIERIKSMVIFLREWKQFFFCEWRPFSYKSKAVNFTYQTESTEEKHVINGIDLPHFSSVAVPKLMDKSLGIPSSFDNDDYLLHVGGSVWTLDWCPRLCENSSGDFKCEYLAISAHPNASEYHKIGEQLSGRGFIQIWCFLHLGDKEELHKVGGKKKVNEVTSVAKHRGRPRKTAIPILNASNAARNTDATENLMTKFSKSVCGNSIECNMPTTICRKNEPRNLYCAGNLNGNKGDDNNLEVPRKRRGRPKKMPIETRPKIRGRPRKHPISSPNVCAIIEGVGDLIELGELVPCNGASIQESCSQFHVHDSEASILLNHVDDCNEIVLVNEESLKEPPFIPEGIALPRLVFSLAHNGKVAWDMKWRPSDPDDINGKLHLGYLAVVLGDGSLEVWEVPVHNLVKQLYITGSTEGTDPRFLKLQPIFRCSGIKFRDRQSIPLALEWSPSASRNLILAGCHDGTVALWKFTTQPSSPDTRPLICFTADNVPIRALAWSPEDSDNECSNLMATAGHNGLKLWDLRDPYHPLFEISPVQRAVLGLDWLKEPRCIVIAYEDGFMRTVSLARIANDTPATGEPFTRTNFGLHYQACSMFAIWSVHVSRSTGLVAYCSSDGSAHYFQLTSEAVDKEASRYRKPHFLCGSFVDEGPSLVINTPSSSTPLPKLLLKKVANEVRPTDSSMRAICYLDDNRISKDKKEAKKVIKEGKTFTSFPSKLVAMYKVRWNMNKGSGRWLCYGGAAGIVRCQVISP